MTGHLAPSSLPAGCEMREVVLGRLHLQGITLCLCPVACCSRPTPGACTSIYAAICQPRRALSNFTDTPSFSWMPPTTAPTNLLDPFPRSRCEALRRRRAPTPAVCPTIQTRAESLHTQIHVKTKEPRAHTSNSYERRKEGPALNFWKPFEALYNQLSFGLASLIWSEMLSCALVFCIATL